MALLYVLLIAIPLSINTRAFIPLIIAVRLLLLGPLFIAPGDVSRSEAAMTLVPLAINFLVWPFLVRGLGATMFENALRRMSGAVGDNHAVAALGYDAMISFGSAMVWSKGGQEWAMNGNGVA